MYVKLQGSNTNCKGVTIMEDTSYYKKRKNAV